MFKGSMVALVTPMQGGVAAECPIDGSSLAKLVQWHIDSGTDAIVAAGTTGESATLNEAEHCELIKQVVAVVAGRIPVIAGTGSNSTHEAIRLTRCAKEVGVDACLLVTPYYNKPTQQGLYLHYKTIAEAVDIPQILYNVPGRTACDMLPAVVARLAQVPNIIGIKDATTPDRIDDLRRCVGDDGFLLLSGEDSHACDWMRRGGHGVISVTANVAPAAMHRMCGSALAGDFTAAQKEDESLQPLHQALFVEPNPIAAKWALHNMGFIGDGIRLPMTWLEQVNQEVVTAAMKMAGVKVNR